MLASRWPAPRAMILSIMLATISAVTAQQITPTNATGAIHPANFLTLTLTPPGQSMTFSIEPLTGPAGLQTTQSISLSGRFNLVTPDSTASGGRGNIAFISCEPSNYPGFVTASNLFTQVAGQSPSAIVLFSTLSDHCNFTLDGKTNFDYQAIYSTIGANRSQSLLDAMNRSPVPFPAAINNSMVTNGTDNGDSPFGPRPTTQIAMIILYSITGLITALFLVIIASGAVRAHRHPERYGPRVGVLGRPRQSRAKGIARAMLETLPIVKFGEKEEDKPAARDVELAEGASSPEHQRATTEGQSTGVISAEEPHSSNGAAKEETASKAAAEPSESSKGVADKAVVAGDAPSSNAHENAESSSSEHEHDHDAREGSDNGLSCSICTEDFVKGEDIRVLPCDHKYHPACVDPWLLNVSGTCPLCRIDLRPAGSSTQDPDSTTPIDPTLAPPLLIEPPTQSSSTPNPAATPHHRNRISRYFEQLRRMPQEERLAALREMRTAQRSGGADPAAIPEEGTPSAAAAPEDATPTTTTTDARRSRRVSALLSSALRVRTRAATGRSPTPATSAPQSAGEAGPSAIANAMTDRTG